MEVLFRRIKDLGFIQFSRVQLDDVLVSGIVKTNRVSSGVDVTSSSWPAARTGELGCESDVDHFNRDLG